jgi:hypothetical protein
MSFCVLLVPRMRDTAVTRFGFEAYGVEHRLAVGPRVGVDLLTLLTAAHILRPGSTPSGAGLGAEKECYR